VILATVETERHFVKVGGQMLCRNLVPRSHDSALQERERRFDRVRVSIANRVFLFGVANCLVFLNRNASFLHREGIGGKVVRNDHIYIFGDVLLDETGKRSALCIFRMEESQIAIALADSDNGLFGVLAIPYALADLLSAYIGLVHFNRAIKHGLVEFAHRGTNAMAEIPRRLVADSDCAVNLVSTHPLLGFTEKVRCREPLNQRQVRIVEDRVRRNSELVIAILAVKQFRVRGKADDVCSLAPNALDSHRPAQPLKQFAASLVIGELLAEVNKRHG